MNKTYQALIFDCDGTIADTMPLHFTTWQTTVTRHQLTFTEQQFYAWAGVPTKTILQRLAQQQKTTVDIDAAAHDKERFYLEALTTIQPIQPILTIIQNNHRKVPMAVASGSLRKTVERTLAQLNILSWFDAIVTAENVQHPKPAPDIFLEAARQLNVPPEACCAFEDSDLGLKAITDAGMTAIDVRKME